MTYPLPYFNAEAVEGRYCVVGSSRTFLIPSQTLKFRNG